MHLLSLARCPAVELLVLSSLYSYSSVLAVEPHLYHRASSTSAASLLRDYESPVCISECSIVQSIVLKPGRQPQLHGHERAAGQRSRTVLSKIGPSGINSTQVVLSPWHGERTTTHPPPRLDIVRAHSPHVLDSLFVVHLPQHQNRFTSCQYA